MLTFLACLELLQEPLQLVHQLVGSQHLVLHLPSFGPSWDQTDIMLSLEYQLVQGTIVINLFSQ